MLQSTVDEIRNNLLYVLDEIVHSRQYLNKHFQNSMNNYFLENYATLPCLKKRFDTQSGRQVRKEIFEKYNQIQQSEGKADGNLKCFLIMRGFIEEHKLNNSLNDYRISLMFLANAAGQDSSIKYGSPEWISLQWRRLFALMVLHHTYYPEVQGVYELWYHVFDERLIARERQKKKKEEVVYKKGKSPYITPSNQEEDEENEHSTSPLLKEAGVTSSIPVRVKEGSLTSLPATDEQITQFSINSPKTPRSLLNIGRKRNLKNTQELKKSQVKLEKQSESDNEDDEPAVSKKRFTQETIVLLKDRCDSSLQETQQYCNSTILINSFCEVLNQNLGNEQDKQQQIIQKVEDNQKIHKQDIQELTDKYIQEQTQINNTIPLNCELPIKINNNNNQQIDYRANIQNKQQQPTNDYTNSGYTFQNQESVNQSYYDNQVQQNYSQISSSQQQQYFPSYRVQNQIDSSQGQLVREFDLIAQPSISYLERQQSCSAYQGEEANNAQYYAQYQAYNNAQVQNKNIIGQEIYQSDYFINCNQENYVNYSYENYNEESNKIKFDQQAMHYTSHNQEASKSYQLQFKSDSNIQRHNSYLQQSDNRGISNNYNNAPMNYQIQYHLQQQNQQQQQQYTNTPHSVVKQNFQQYQQSYPSQNCNQVTSDYPPIDSSYSSGLDAQSEYYTNSNSYSSSSSPSAYNQQECQPYQQNYMNQKYTNYDQCDQIQYQNQNYPYQHQQYNEYY